MECHYLARSAINQMFIEDCVSLFEHYECDALYHLNYQSCLPTYSIGVIDAGGPELELTLLLNVPFSILALSYPCQDVIVGLPEEQLEDWLLELANQLMGKIKARLTKQNVYVSLGLPESFFDVSSIAYQMSWQSSECLVFEIDGEFMECWLHVDIKVDQLDITEVQDESAFSGEIELF